jgi:hypothetical protein
MLISEKLNNLWDGKNNLCVTYEEMEEIFGRDYHRNLIQEKSLAKSKLFFSENQNIFYISLICDAFDRSFNILQFKEESGALSIYSEVDEELFEEIYMEYENKLGDLKKYEEVVMHKKFRLFHLFRK